MPPKPFNCLRVWGERQWAISYPLLVSLFPLKELDPDIRQMSHIIDPQVERPYTPLYPENVEFLGVSLYDQLRREHIAGDYPHIVCN